MLYPMEIDTISSLHQHVLPMPLKHNTETLLVFFLGLVTAVTAIVCVFLPPVTVTVWPWLIAFILALTYPVALYPLFRERRVDKPFRLLHFAPAVLLAVWLATDLLAGFRTDLSAPQRWLTWNGMIAPVALVLALVIWFCLSVIRQRGTRLFLLALLLAGVALFGFLNERHRWDRQLAATLWGQSGSLVIADGNVSSTPESWWRAQLRSMQDRSRAIQNGDTDSVPSATSRSSASSVLIAAGSSSSVSSVPPNLTHAGPVADVLVLLTTSGYCAALQRRTMKRRQA